MPTDSDRLKVSRYALDYLYRADESFNKYVDNLNKSVAEITMEDILDISFIEILELSEERLKYAKKYHEHSNEMSIDEYLSKQAPLLNKRHNLTFNAIGFDFPIEINRFTA